MKTSKGLTEIMDRLLADGVVFGSMVKGITKLALVGSVPKKRERLEIRVKIERLRREWISWRRKVRNDKKN